MLCGISTACFYPHNTLAALEQVARLGAPVTEIFINTFSELEEPFVSNLAAAVADSGVKVASLHPFSTMLDGFFFASDYPERLQDGLLLYEKYFKLCQRLGAGKVVLHGDHRKAKFPYPIEQYAANCKRLAVCAASYGVRVCHENVVYCRTGDPAYIRALRPLLGDNAAFVLDTKQVLRAGETVDTMLSAMGGALCHIHLSDHTESQDCLPPGQGDFDFAAFFQRLQNAGYAGDVIIELYRDSYKSNAELKTAMEYINTTIQQTQAR